MSTPPNPLDDFITYTYHFELHAAKTWKELLLLDTQGDDHGEFTSPHSAKDTLFINTRRDAHQTIDNVRFTYMCSGASIAAPNGAAPMSYVTMDIFEPGGMFFAEKLRKQYEKYDMTGNNLLFALRIFFVGQKRDEQNTTVKLRYMIPMYLMTMSANFTYTGGQYNLAFNIVTNLTPRFNEDNPLAFNAAYVNKSISISASTVKEAMSELEKKLNENWERTYSGFGPKNVKTIVNSRGVPVTVADNARRLKYRIIIDPNIDGALDSTMKNSTQAGDKQKLTFLISDDIGAMIKKILSSSKKINDMVADSGDRINVEFQPGVKYCTINPAFCPQDEYAEIIYDIKLYEGGAKLENQYEFDYYFSEAGKNVDVIEFQMKFPELANRFLSISSDCLDLFANLNATVPSGNPGSWGANTCHPDVTKHKLENVEAVTAASLRSGSGDFAWCPAIHRDDNTGQVTKDYASVNSSRLAFSSSFLGNLLSTPEITFSIRGNLDILEKCITYPDPDLNVTAFGTVDGTWIKVNIYGLDENHQRVPFFYTGFYMLFQVENVFSGGVFTQFLKIYMAEKEATKTASTPPSISSEGSVKQHEGMEHKNPNPTVKPYDPVRPSMGPLAKVKTELHSRYVGGKIGGK